MIAPTSVVQSLNGLLKTVSIRAKGITPTEVDGGEIIIRSITQHSESVESGSLFCAIRGTTNDGHRFVDDAVQRGAAAVVVERPTTAEVPEVVVRDGRLAAGHLAAAFAGNPTDDVRLVGVTGTNGKTSIVTLLAHIVNNCGGIAASTGTLTGSLTTAAAPEFQLALRRYREAGTDVVAAEISSHALDQQRIAGSSVAVAVFSNLSQDHLDYHHTMDEYFAAKAKLFSEEFAADAVIEVSDPWGRRLMEDLRRDAFGEDADAGAERQLVEVDGGVLVATATLRQTSSTFDWRGIRIDLPIGGAFSITNAVLAAEAAVLLGFDQHRIAEALGNAPQIPGRFESIDAGQPFAVIVDYSHTPASVAAAIDSARELADNRVVIVFGAAGDRDPGKRPLMGTAATAADVLFVTSDNPRTEDPERIIDDVLAGIDGAPRTPTAVHRVADRGEAIISAISGALPGDVVVIAGKGHEDYQIVGTTRSDFDDRVHARAALASLGWESAS
ncbi:MAG: UDP-N-acetylmuramoyl-L-alanyl-D-glutamate--2,6-diaminopimelate ligase [Verrucomicrobiales bacterium]|jgi:UDP-N-acetylmuramoyl-L-alanyl-D-glutamate--2,6-diaminopimelate ligase